MNRLAPFLQTGKQFRKCDAKCAGSSRHTHEGYARLFRRFQLADVGAMNAANLRKLLLRPPPLLPKLLNAFAEQLQ